VAAIADDYASSGEHLAPRHGTEAASLAEQVPEEVKHERLERLVEVVQRIAAERNEERVGTVEEVLVEGFSRTDDTLLRGRTRGNVTVVFTGEAAPGELVDVLIEGATSTTLRGAETDPSHSLVTLGACAS
jgi:tRNA-2-methylthio-N6-dimethylallyladenosine synthase